MSEEKCPKTVDEAVTFLLQILDDDTKNYIRQFNDKRSATANLHMELGLWIRNEWIHGNKCPELLQSYLNTAEQIPFFDDPDEISSYFTGLLWERLQSN